MSEYHFGLGRGRVDETIARKIDRVAQRHGATFVWGGIPGEGPRFWFACPNQGEPFDRATRDAVIEELVNAGLWDRAARRPIKDGVP